MRIDSHAHLEPRMLDVDRMVAKMDAAGVDRVVLIPAMNDPLPETPDRLLAVVRRLLRSAPGRLLAERIHRATLTAEGDNDYRTEILDPVLARAQELHLPVLVHLGFGARGDYRAMAERFPRLTVIAAHAGFPFFDRLWSHARRSRNLYVDLSSPYLDERVARAAVERMGPERVLYGTDSPYGFHEADGSYDYGEIAGWVSRMPVRDQDRERIFGGNFLGLVGDQPGRIVLQPGA